jgi:hypothetical protein
VRNSAPALLLALALLLAPGRARACASCGCGDPTLTAAGIEKPYLNRVRLVVDNRYGSFTQGADGSSEHTEFLRSSIGLAWTPHPRITVALLVPWVTSYLTPVSHSPGADRGVVSGLGDVELSARALLYQERHFAPHHLLWGMSGLKFPSGYRVRSDSGDFYSDDDQPGSGSWDPFAAVTYAWYSGGLMSAFASTSYRQTTPGWHGNRRGSTLGGSLAVQAQPWQRVALAVGADVAWQQPDRLPNNHDAPSTGGTVLYVAPALLVSPATDWLIRLVVDVPAVAALYGTQTVGTQVALSIAYDVH